MCDSIGQTIYLLVAPQADERLQSAISRQYVVLT